MNKRIEDYINENKKEFDFKAPSEQLWERIDAELTKKRSKNRALVPFWFGIAASLILIATVVFLNSDHRKEGRGHKIADNNVVYANKQMKFASLIEEKKDSLQIYAKKNPVLYARFSTDLNKLGSDYESLKKELQTSPNQKVVVKAMVRNLELQLQVINQQLSIINEVNQYREENQI